MSEKISSLLTVSVKMGCYIKEIAETPGEGWDKGGA